MIRKHDQSPPNSTLRERMYRRGLAARPKVDDAEALAADLKKTQIELDSEFHRAKSAEAKLAEREAELARAYEAFLISEMTGTLLDDKSSELINEVRNAARQQKKAPAEPTEGEGE